MAMQPGYWKTLLTISMDGAVGAILFFVCAPVILRWFGLSMDPLDSVRDDSMRDFWIHSWVQDAILMIFLFIPVFSQVPSRWIFRKEWETRQDRPKLDEAKVRREEEDSRLPPKEPEWWRKYY